MKESSLVASVGLLRLLGGAWFASEVGGDEELGEQNEVRNVYGNAKVQSGEGHVTRATVCLSVVCVEGDKGTHDHLGNLRDRDHHGQLSWNTDAQSAQRIVAVHNSVNSVVHGAVPTTGRSLVRVCEPSEDEHTGMMVPVQKDELLLTQHHEHRVH